MADIPIEIAPVEGLVALIRGIQDGTLSRDEFIEAADAAVETGALEPFEEAGWGAVYDLFAPMVGRIHIPKVQLFSKRTPAELREDADEAAAAGKTKKAERLRRIADSRESRAA